MARLLEHLAAAFVGNKRQTGDKVLSIAQRGRRDPGVLNHAEIRSLCMSVISQARR